ncbi:hypothetical protein [Desulfosporosinus meridiei]|uniref:Uncharacterized protein n=1 Tax=Desulfosporosinus meridiei (strain ATCC BAA-275 / DSM 13257 / KCTC 12902 / NCIMB 13706 / S10) TaxID=768704 RepID=J7ITQ0_DESMD|nr:hypothetical protein [Desulfosporosinus meridiei]AFQ43539.1 hypothetical protein Desmer_1548 [Desulfosporosinus meridiei DSM 13257]
MKKRNILIVCLVMVYLLTVLKGLNYDLFEIKISTKALLRQNLSLEEMKRSSIYKAYNHIENDTTVEEIDNLLNKKSKNIYNFLETWYYPYGYVSIRYDRNKESRVLHKLVSFESPYVLKLSDEELYSVFECNSLEKIISLLGEPTTLGKDYNTNGEAADYYSWGIKTSYSKEFIKDIEKKYNEYVNVTKYDESVAQPINSPKIGGRSDLSVTIKADNKIEGYSLFESH